jgi:hypothetical protein
MMPYCSLNNLADEFATGCRHVKNDLLGNSKTSAVLKYYSIIYFKYGELRRK